MITGSNCSRKICSWQGNIIDDPPPIQARWTLRQNAKVMCLERKGRGRYHVQSRAYECYWIFSQLAVGLKSSDHPCVSGKIPPCLGLGLTTAPFIVIFSSFTTVLVENRLSNPFTIVKVPSFRIYPSIDNNMTVSKWLFALAHFYFLFFYFCIFYFILMSPKNNNIKIKKFKNSKNWSKAESISNKIPPWSNWAKQY